MAEAGEGEAGTAGAGAAGVSSAGAGGAGAGGAGAAAGRTAGGGAGLTDAAAATTGPADARVAGIAASSRLNVRAGVASVTVAACLVLIKLWALGETGALTVAASLADSAVDLMVSLGAIAAMVYAARPPDADHAFGHTSAEDIAALGQAFFIAVSGLVIGAAAVMRLASHAPSHLAQEGRGIAAMALSVVLTLGLVTYQARIARRTGSRVVKADRLHYIGDLVPSAGALVSLWASAALGLDQIDAVIAIAAALMLVAGSARIGRGAFDALMDRRADPAVVAAIAQQVRGWPGVAGFHDLRTRTAGARVFVQVHVELDGALSLREAHDIAAGLRRAILARHPQADVIIHKDVATGSAARSRARGVTRLRRRARARDAPASGRPARSAP